MNCFRRFPFHTYYLHFRLLHYISITCLTISLGFATCLPSVESARISNSFGMEKSALSSKPFLTSIKTDTLSLLGNGYVLKWSLWWALGTCGHFQVSNYIQPLWETILPSKGSDVAIFNGAVDAGSTLTSAVLTVLFGHMRFNWRLIGEPVIAMVAILNGLMLVFMANTDKIAFAYGGYIGYKALYNLMMVRLSKLECRIWNTFHFIPISYLYT